MKSRSVYKYAVKGPDRLLTTLHGSTESREWSLIILSIQSRSVRAASWLCCRRSLSEGLVYSRVTGRDAAAFYFPSGAASLTFYLVTHLSVAKQSGVRQKPLPSLCHLTYCKRVWDSAQLQVRLPRLIRSRCVIELVRHSCTGSQTSFLLDG